MKTPKTRKSIFSRKPRTRKTAGHSEKAIYGKGWRIIDREFLED